MKTTCLFDSDLIHSQQIWKKCQICQREREEEEEDTTLMIVHLKQLDQFD